MGGWATREGDAVNGTKLPQILRSVSRLQLRHPPVSPSPSTLFSLPPPCRPAPAAPQGATLSGICVELAASLRLVFFFFSPLAGRI